MASLTGNVSKHRLDNGLTILLKEKKSCPIVAIYTYVKVGYFNEPDRLTGISHLIEHLFFKGTERRTVGQIAQETRQLGGYLNAATIYDHTLYYTVLPKEHFSQGLDLQSDALIHSVFNQEEIQKETEVVIQEAKRKLDMPASIAREKLFETAYTKHRMRRWRIGSEEGLRAFSRDDIVGFYKQSYRPENMILTVIGDIDTARALSEIEKYYGNFPKGILRFENSPGEPQQQSMRAEFMTGDIQRAHFAAGFHTTGDLHEDAIALQILGQILGQGRSSRFYQNVKENKNLVESISSYNYTLADLGIFMIEATTDPQKVRGAEEAIFDEIAKIQDTPVTGDELKKARARLEASYVFSLQSAAGQAGILASYEALGDYRLVDDFMKKFYTVQSEKLMDVGRRYLHPSNCSLFEYAPKNIELSSFDSVKVSDRFAKLSQSKTVEPVKISTQAPFNVSLGSQTSGQLRQFDLLCGGRLWVMPLGQLPIISCGIYSAGGRAMETISNTGVSALLTMASKKGTENYSAAGLAKAIDKLGISISYSAQADYFACETSTLSRHFDAAWPLMTEVLFRSNFPDEQVDYEKGQMLARIERVKDDMLQRPLQLYYQNIFIDHPYGLPALGVDATLAELQREDLIRWRARVFSPQNILVVIAGDCDADEMLEKVASGMAFLPTGLEQKEKVLDCMFRENSEPRVEYRNKQQTGLVLGFPGPKATDDEYYPLTVLQNIVSGLGGRFFEELRGRQSLAYSVSAYLVARKFGGSFFSYIACSPENEEKARRALLNEFRRLREERVSQTELERAIQYTIGIHKIALEENQAQMSELAFEEIIGRGGDSTGIFYRKIAEVSQEDIRQAANKYFVEEKCAQGIVRGASRAN